MVFTNRDSIIFPYDVIYISLSEFDGRNEVMPLISLYRTLLPHDDRKRITNICIASLYCETILEELLLTTLFDKLLCLLQLVRTAVAIASIKTFFIINFVYLFLITFMLDKSKRLTFTKKNGNLLKIRKRS